MTSEAVGYALQIQVNPGRPSAYWKFDDEFGGARRTLDAAVADLDEARDYGFGDDDLRVVALSVVYPPGEQVNP